MSKTLVFWHFVVHKMGAYDWPKMCLRISARIHEIVRIRTPPRNQFLAGSGPSHPLLARIPTKPRILLRNWPENGQIPEKISDFVPKLVRKWPESRENLGLCSEIGWKMVRIPSKSRILLRNWSENGQIPEKISDFAPTLVRKWPESRENLGLCSEIGPKIVRLPRKPRILLRKWSDNDQNPQKTMCIMTIRRSITPNGISRRG